MLLSFREEELRCWALDFWTVLSGCSMFKSMSVGVWELQVWQICIYMPLISRF